MKTIKLKGVDVSFYDDLKEIPMYKLNAFQIALVQDAGMGSSIFDVDTRLSKLDAFLDAGKLKEARKERENMRLGFFFMLNSINTSSLALAHLVESINGKKFADTTETDIQAISQQLEAGGITYGEVLEVLDEVKKKLIPTLNSTSQN